ncbi:signal peptidase II [Thiobacter aerophilum]|uniref:Lipoprotein signal peptidase n=1 Tax=Thiobacter aerophilum TaxID=3121275 RepID=A0ABV0EJH1_9BURK
MLKARRFSWYGLAVVLIALDQASKAWVTTHFLPGEQRTVTPFFNLVLAHNTGAAFSLLAEAGGWQRVFFIAVALIATAVIVWLIERHREEPRFCFALSLILGGALGNLIDRLRLGYVVDFLDFHAAGWHWPAFNVADTAITVGALLLVWDSLRRGTASKS